MFCQLRRRRFAPSNAQNFEYQNLRLVDLYQPADSVCGHSLHFRSILCTSSAFTQTGIMEQELITNCFITNIFLRRLHLTPKTRRIMLMCHSAHSYVMPLTKFIVALACSDGRPMRDSAVGPPQRNLTDSTLFSNLGESKPTRR